MTRKLINILFRFIAILVLILALVLIVFSIPNVQSYFAEKATSFLKEKYNVGIDLQGIRLSVTGDIVLQEPFVKDHHNDTLVYAKTISTSLRGFNQILKGDTNLPYAILEEAYVKMQIYPNEEIDNMRVFINSFKKNKKKSNREFKLHIGRINLENSKYYFSKKGSEILPIILKNIDLKAVDLDYRNKEFHISSQDMHFVYNNYIDVNQALLAFTYQVGHLYFDIEQFETNAGSKISGALALDYNADGVSFSDFNNCVVLDALVEKSRVASNDIHFFYDKLGRKEFFDIETKFYGTLNDFRLEDLKLGGLGKSKIIGDLSFLGVRSKQLKEDFRYSGNLQKLQTTKIDLERLLPSLIKDKLPEKLETLGAIDFTGKVSGTSKDIDFKGNITSFLGNVEADLEFLEVTEPENTKYKGHITVDDFELGAYFNNKKLGQTSFDLKVNGKGFLLGSISTILEGNFSKLYYNNYQYRDISVFGLLDDPVFDGKIIAKDPNFDLFFDGKVNLEEGHNDYDFKADVKFIDFNKTRLFKRDSISTFKGIVDAELKGTTVDNVVGKINFKKTTYTNQNDVYEFKDFNLETGFLKNGDRLITANSPEIISGYLKGKFLVKDIKPLIKNNIESLYLKGLTLKTITEKKYVDFDLKVYNKILEVFYPELKVASNTFLKGYFSDDLAKTKLKFNSPEVIFKKNIVEGLDLVVNKEITKETVFKMDKFINKWYSLSDFAMQNRKVGDSVVIHMDFKGGKKFKDNFSFKTYLIPSDIKTEFGINKANINFKDHDWNLVKSKEISNKIVFDKVTDSIRAYPIQIQHKSEEIQFAGKSRDSTYKDFQLSFGNVNLEKITPPIDSLNYYGMLNGRVLFRQKGKRFLPQLNLNVSNFTINDLEMGDLSLFFTANEDLSKYILQGALENEEFEGLNIAGEISVADKETKVAVDLLLSNLDLKPFNPLAKGILTDIHGKASGKVKVFGSLDEIDYSGQVRLNKSGLKIPYLNVGLDLEENSMVTFKKNEIVFQKQTVTDAAFKTEGIFEGSITHDWFTDWGLDLSLKSSRFLVLNTNASDNDLYYGTAFIDGYATLKGSTDKPIIEVVASSGKGTTFKIPISDTESIGDNSFIHFITPQEKLAEELGEEYNFDDIKGVELAFELDLNENAEVEVVVDQESGSTLKGYGAGTLLIEINTNGKFNMWGDFVAYKGTYDFKYGGVLSKSFEVESGGSINWNGSPTGAFLNLSAVYNTNANPAILLENSTVNRKIPVQVITSLKGELLKPDLNFDIKFPRASSTLRSELDFILADQTMKERQAFSLVTQGQFYSDALITGNNLLVENLLVERASSIVNGLFANEDDKFKVGLNYVAGERNPDQDIADQVGVSLSTQINDRILINGKVGVPVGGISESVVVGDVQVDFLLNEDGTLRATIFNRENDLQFVGETIGFTQGVGLSYSYDFDTFKELLRKVFVKAKK